MAKKSAPSKPAKSPARKTSDKKAAERDSQPVSAGEREVTIDRRRGEREEGAGAPSSAPKLERRKKVQRRRQIDPTTCERDYSLEEVEFMNAMDDYKRKSGRMFPTCSEVLEVIRSLGYVKLSPAGQAMLASEGDLAGGEMALADADLVVAESAW
jgi:hypothetical protein